MKLSVITVNYYNADGAERTLNAVLAQTCKAFFGNDNLQ